MDREELERQILSFPKLIYERKKELIELIEKESEHKQRLHRIRLSLAREVEDEYDKTKGKNLSTIDKREYEVRLRLQENKAGSLIFPVLEDIQKKIMLLRLDIEKEENLFKAYRAIVGFEKI